MGSDVKLDSVWDDMNRYETSTIRLLVIALLLGYSLIASKFCTIFEYSGADPYAMADLWCAQSRRLCAEG